VKNVAVTRCLLCQHKAGLPQIVPASIAGTNKDSLEEDRTTKNVHSYLGCKRNAIKRKRPTEMMEDIKKGAGATVTQSLKSSTENVYSYLKKQPSVTDLKSEASTFSFLKSNTSTSRGGSGSLSRNASTASLSSVGGYAKSAIPLSAGAGAGGVSLLDLERNKKRQKKLARKAGR
jgi:hypothetical protein